MSIDFWRQIVTLYSSYKVTNRDVFFTLKSFRNQFQSTTHFLNVGKRVRLSTYHYKLFYFNLNVLKFELQYEWTRPQIFFCAYRILQLFCYIKSIWYPWYQVVNNSWNWNFADFRDFVVILPKADTGVVL